MAKAQAPEPRTGSGANWIERKEVFRWLF